MKSRHRQMSEKLARQLSDPKRLQFWELSRAWTRSGKPPEPELSPSSAAGNGVAATDDRESPGPVSIWTPRQDAHGSWVYARPQPSLFGDHYSAELGFSLKKATATRRICFFGESVAAGYLFAPRVTPAQLLRHQLNADQPNPSFEVIDLAKTNETLEPLLQTFKQSLVLEPDVAVIFAGNNWNLLEEPQASAYYPSAAARREFAQAMQSDGILGPIEHAAKARMVKAGHILGEIERLAQAAQVRLVVVVPEVNLMDWHDCQPVTWLEADGTQQWYRHFANAEAALAKGDSHAALAAGIAMSELDGATNSTSFRIQALAHQRLGDHDACLQACRHEVDAGQYAAQCYIGSPRIAPLEQEILRRFAAKGRHGLVDLPKVFATSFPEEVPGKRLFVDYCHLTLEGMTLAMAATHREILQNLYQETPTVPKIKPLQPSPTTLATACFGAAVHSAHRMFAVGPKQELLSHWCRQAIEHHPDAVAMMLAYIDAHTTREPVILSQGQQTNLGFEAPLTPQHGWGYPHFDAQLILAIGQILKADFPEESRRIDGLIRDRLAIGAEGTNLLESAYFLWEPVARSLPEVMDMGALPSFFRATWPETHVAVITQENQAIRLAVCIRLPPGEPATNDSHLHILINGESVGRLPLLSQWQNHSINLPAVFLQPGINKLTLAWPLPRRKGSDALRVAQERLANGLAAEIHPIFGELFTLKAYLLTN